MEVMVLAGGIYGSNRDARATMAMSGAASARIALPTTRDEAAHFSTVELMTQAK
jgi:hypothetical protein